MNNRIVEEVHGFKADDGEIFPTEFKAKEHNKLLDMSDLWYEIAPSEEKCSANPLNNPVLFASMIMDNYYKIKAIMEPSI
jgi:hypothetical protein